MAQCKNCGADLTSRAKFCTRCGERVTPTEKDAPTGDAVGRLKLNLRERFCLSLPSLEWLKERGLLRIEPGSPLNGVLGSEFRTTESERHSAGAALTARGAGLEAPKTEEKVCVSEFRAALSILGNPESRLDLSIWAPNRPPIIIPLFISDGSIVLGYKDRLSFYVGLPFEKDRLVEALVSNLQGAPGGTHSIVVWPAHLQAVTLIWRGSRRNASDSVERNTAVNAMLRAGYNKFRAEKIITALGKAQFLHEASGSLALENRYRVCMECIWSGHMFELRHTSLRQPAGRTGIYRTRAPRLRFVGPPGRRLLCTTITIRARVGSAQLEVKNRTEEQRVLLLRPMSATTLKSAVQSVFSYEGPPASSVLESCNSSACGGLPTGQTFPLDTTSNVEMFSQTKSEYQTGQTCTRCGAPTGSRKFCTKCGQKLA